MEDWKNLKKAGTLIKIYYNSDAEIGTSRAGVVIVQKFWDNFCFQITCPKCPDGLGMWHRSRTDC